MDYSVYSKKQLRAAICAHCSAHDESPPVSLPAWKKKELARLAREQGLIRYDIEGPSQLNRMRIQAADFAVYVHGREIGSREEDAGVNLTDLLANLRHWADANDLDFEAAADMSQQHFEAEQAEDIAS